MYSNTVAHMSQPCGAGPSGPPQPSPISTSNPSGPRGGKMGVNTRGRWLFGVSSRVRSRVPTPVWGGGRYRPPGGGRHQSCVGHRSSPPMRGEEAPPPRGGRHPPLAVWAPVILMVRVVWHSYQVLRRVGSGRGPLGLWSASGGFGCGRRVRVICSGRVLSGGPVTAYGCVARGGSSARAYVCGP